MHSPETIRYNDILEQFLSIERRIWIYTGRGDPEEFLQFVQRTKDVRVMFQRLFEYFFNSADNYDVILLNKMLSELITVISQLGKDFDDWVAKNNPSDECKLTSCGPSDVKDLRACKCIYIDGWNQLPSINNSLNFLLVRINNLTIDAANKDNLLANWLVKQKY